LTREGLQKTLRTTPPLSGPVDGGAEDARGVAADVAAEDDLHVSGAADVQVAGDQCLEEAAGAAGRVEDDGAGHLDLPHRALPPVPGVLVCLPERHREAGQPPLGEDLDGAGLQPVADRLQAGRVVAGGEPAGQGGEPDAGLDRLALGPLVPVDPDPGRVGQTLTNAAPGSSSQR
jgi:hypothetical protein